MPPKRRNATAAIPDKDESGQAAPAPKRRRATVYDATAGRLSQRGFIPTHPVPTKKNSDRVSQPTVPARPDEVLFRRKRAPPRYAESDYYFAHSELPEGALPRSDLLKAIHWYIAAFYETSGMPPDDKIWQSMDETALLALGILMEETARGILGETGDLAFVEGVEPEGAAGTD